MRSIFFALVFIAVVGISCKKQQPEDVAQSFYKFLNTNDFEKAKELATPSAIEYIEHLKELLGNNSKGDSLELSVMDVKKKELPMEGDTAIINYKIGNFKSYIKLVYTNGSYKVFNNEELPTLRIVEYDAVDLFNQFKELDYQVFWKKYGCFRFRIKTVLGIVKPEGLFGIPYDVPNNTSPIYKAAKNFNNVRDFILKFRDKEVSLTGKTESLLFEQPFVFSSFTSPEEKNKITCEIPHVMFGESNIYNSTSLLMFEGVLSKVDQYHHYMYFDQCTIK